VTRNFVRTPDTVRFLRRAAPNLVRTMRREYSREVLPAPFRPQPNLWPDTGLHATWLGHSTVLVRMDGLTLLTDPVFSERAGLRLGGMTLGLKRLVEVALPLSELIPIDLILLSHAHMDHFDTPSLRSLENTGTTIVTATRTADLLRGRRWKAVHQLGWGQSARVKDATVTAFEVAHWGARMRSDLYRGYNGYVVETDRHRIIFGGDTAMTDTFRETRSSRRTDLALMPIGAYDPWIRVHCNPEQAMLMAEQAGAEHILPVHHKTFQLSREPYTEPIERLLSAAGASPERVAVRDIGQEFHLTI
jgi:L-ascorbate metabolism protein UlaG (beta-lactamase superfamily)